MNVQCYRVNANPLGITLIDDLLEGDGSSSPDSNSSHSSFRTLQRLTLLEMTAIFDESNIECTVSIPSYGNRKPTAFKRSKGFSSFFDSPIPLFTFSLWLHLFVKFIHSRIFHWHILIIVCQLVCHFPDVLITILGCNLLSFSFWSF